MLSILIVSSIMLTILISFDFGHLFRSKILDQLVLFGSKEEPFVVHDGVLILIRPWDPGKTLTFIKWLEVTSSSSTRMVRDPFGRSNAIPAAWKRGRRGLHRLKLGHIPPSTSQSKWLLFLVQSGITGIVSYLFYCFCSHVVLCWAISRGYIPSRRLLQFYCYRCH